jgi:hypothetical protein
MPRIAGADMILINAAMAAIYYEISQPCRLDLEA